jgi:predicted nucleic acid-binding protein
VTRYFDTSALVPYYRPEPASEACEALLLASGDAVVVSDLVEVEFASVVARLVRMGELDEDGARRVERAFAEDAAEGRYRRVAVEGGHFGRARDWLRLRTTALRLLDALHLAVAAGLGAELVTADGTLAEAGERLGLAVKRVGG